MASKYVDISSIIQVIGGVYCNPSLLDQTDKYNITDEDFVEDFHKIVFGSIFKLHELGAQKITLEAINDFLSTRPKSAAVYKQQKGDEWLTSVIKSCDKLTFDYYYSRLKKFTLLRAYDNFGVDLTKIYDADNIFDNKKKEQQEEFLDNSTLENIADIIDNEIEAIRIKYVDECDSEAAQAGEGIFDLIENFKKYPEVGVPLFGPYINAVTRGARLKKFYLRSAPTGVGKTRSMVADACYIGCAQMYDETFGWIKTGPAQPTLYITTEQDLSEIQTMMLAFLSNVNEDHILNGEYVGDEEQRVIKAGEILNESPIYIEQLPDFSLRDVEDTIKKNLRDKGVRYIFHDYIHTSMKILEEITKRSGGVKLREDNILFMLSNKLKDICNQYGVFILSATQLSSDYQDAETPDQNLLRGAKSIADKIDAGLIILPAKKKDWEALKDILNETTFDVPTLKISVYKNRRGKYKGIYLWCKSELGTCRIIPMFATGYDYSLIQIEDLKIMVKEEEGLF